MIGVGGRREGGREGGGEGWFKFSMSTVLLALVFLQWKEAGVGDLGERGRDGEVEV